MDKYQIERLRGLMIGLGAVIGVVTSFAIAASANEIGGLLSRLIYGALLGSLGGFLFSVVVGLIFRKRS